MVGRLSAVVRFALATGKGIRKLAQDAETSRLRAIIAAGRDLWRDSFFCFEA